MLHKPGDPSSVLRTHGKCRCGGIDLLSQPFTVKWETDSQRQENCLEALRPTGLNNTTERQQISPQQGRTEESIPESRIPLTYTYKFWHMCPPICRIKI